MWLTLAWIIFDYLMRNHYNGDGSMTQHLYEVAKGEVKLQTTIEQAYLAEAVGYAAIQSAEKGEVVHLRDIIPDDLNTELIIRESSGTKI